MKTKKSKYVVGIYGANITRATYFGVDSLAKARGLAESYGDTADFAIISDRATWKFVAAHARDRGGDGLNWFRSY